jgi:hypothetical protein
MGPVWNYLSSKLTLSHEQVFVKVLPEIGTRISSEFIPISTYVIHEATI